MLNYPTLLLVLVGFTALTSLLLVVAALSDNAQTDQRLWALGNVVVCVGFAIAVQTTLPTVVHGGISYGFMSLGLALVLRGLRQFQDKRFSWWWVFAVTLVAFALPAYFATIQPNQTARLVVSGIFDGLLNLACAITLLPSLRARMRSVVWISVTGFAVLGVSLILRAVFLLTRAYAPDGGQTDDSVLALTILITALAQVSIAFGLVMLVSLRYVEKLNQLTLMDGLTGTLNRVGLDRMGQRVLMRARQGHRSVAVAMVDADFFKSINDTHGHAAGDAVLVHLSKILTAQVRPGDLVIRYGGEEFVLILDGSNEESATRIAERLRGLIADDCVTGEWGDIRYQVSIGVSCTKKSGYVLSQLLSDADSAMYRAKQDGRNRVCVA